MISIAPFSGATFWILLVAFVLAHALITRLGGTRTLRNVYMAATSLAVVLMAQGITSQGVVLVALVLVLSAVVFQAGRLLAAGHAGSKGWLTIGPIVLVVGVLCYFKYSQFQMLSDSLARSLIAALGFGAEPATRRVYLLGVSYFSFKFIHYLVDCATGKIKRPSGATFINYTLFFPSFFGGPINRYENFEQDLADSKGRDFLGGVQRIITGLFKKIVLAAGLYPVSVVALDLSDPTISPVRAIAGIYAYALFVYFDFSGYTDLAIGSAKLVGVNLPENFNYPFFRRNLRDFWANWHMSLTTWLTDYIYWPLARKFRHVRALESRPVTTSNIAIITTFMVCGVWHGDGLNFLVWGTYHGVGLAVLNGYTLIVRRYFPRRLQRFVRNSKIAYGISNFITIQYAVFGFLLFGSDLARLGEFFRIFGA